jgi:hypothetical protein
MSDMGTDRLEPASPVLDRLGTPGRREDGPRQRRQPPPPPQEPEPPADLEGPVHEPAHQVDSLA